MSHMSKTPSIVFSLLLTSLLIVLVLLGLSSLPVFSLYTCADEVTAHISSGSAHVVAVISHEDCKATYIRLSNVEISEENTVECNVYPPSDVTVCNMYYEDNLCVKWIPIAVDVENRKPYVEVEGRKISDSVIEFKIKNAVPDTEYRLVSTIINRGTVPLYISEVTVYLGDTPILRYKPSPPVMLKPGEKTNVKLKLTISDIRPDYEFTVRLEYKLKQLVGEPEDPQTDNCVDLSGDVEGRICIEITS